MAREIQYNKEADVKRRVKKILTDHGWFYFMPAANGFGNSGISDILALKDGVFLAIETKFGSNKPSAMQKGFLQSIHSAGGFGVVVNEKTVTTFESFLDAFQRSAEATAKGEKPADDDAVIMLNAMHEMTKDIV